MKKAHQIQVVVEGNELVEVTAIDLSEVRIEQSLMVVEAGVMGSPVALDLDEVGDEGRPKYFPMTYVEPSDDPNELGDEATFNSISELATFLDEVEHRTGATPWAWNGSVFTRTIDAHLTDVPKAIVLPVVTPQGEFAYRQEFMELVDKDGKTIELHEADRDRPRLRFADGDEAAGFHGVLGYLNQRYEVPGGQVNLNGFWLTVTGASNWSVGKNLHYKNGEVQVLTRHTKSQHLGETPGQLVAEVL